MQVTSEILGFGSCGTIVFSGTLDGRQVVVKRILRQFNELAHKEISALIMSDEVSSSLQKSDALPVLVIITAPSCIGRWVRCDHKCHPIVWIAFLTSSARTHQLAWGHGEYDSSAFVCQRLAICIIC